MKMLKPILFVHCCVDKQNRYKSIIDELLSTINKSSLDKHAEIKICSVGEQADEWWFDLNRHDSDTERGEFFTLGMIHKLCREVNGSFPIGYIHTKGVFNGFDNPCIADWRQYMSYFTIEKATDCFLALDSGNDVVGVDWVNYPNRHFSGNFWWANSSYIKNLPNIDPPNFFVEGVPSHRHLAEFWIGYGNPKVKSLHQSNINVYERHLHRYYKEQYREDVSE